MNECLVEPHQPSLGVAYPFDHHIHGGTQHRLRLNVAVEDRPIAPAGIEPELDAVLEIETLSCKLGETEEREPGPETPGARVFVGIQFPTVEALAVHLRGEIERIDWKAVVIDEADQFRAQMGRHVVKRPVHRDPVRPVGIPLGIVRQAEIGDAPRRANLAMLRARVARRGVVEHHEAHVLDIALPRRRKEIDHPGCIEGDRKGDVANVIAAKPVDERQASFSAPRPKGKIHGFVAQVLQAAQPTIRVDDVGNLSNEHDNAPGRISALLFHQTGDAARRLVGRPCWSH